MAKEHAVWSGVGVLGRVLVTAYAGYSLARFEPSPRLPWEKHLGLPMKVVGYGLAAYAGYDLLRLLLLKAK